MNRKRNSFVMCGLISPSCCRLKWKQTQGTSGVYCANTGFWLPIPTCPTFWNSFVIIISIAFMPINTVSSGALPLCVSSLCPLFQHILEMVTKWQRRNVAALVGL